MNLEQPLKTIPPGDVFGQYGPLLSDWLRRLHALKRAHFRAAWHFECRNRRYGRITIVLSTGVPPILVLLGQADLRALLGDTSFYILAFGVAAAVAGILATLQIFDRDSERAERHKVAGANFATLEADLELLIAALPKPAEEIALKVSDFRDQWTRHTGSSPVIPEWIFKAIENEVERPSALLARFRQNAAEPTQPFKRDSY